MEMRGIASGPVEDHYFNVDTFDDLASIENDLISHTCRIPVPSESINSSVTCLLLMAFWRSRYQSSFGSRKMSSIFRNEPCQEYVRAFLLLYHVRKDKRSCKCLELKITKIQTYNLSFQSFQVFQMCLL